MNNDNNYYESRQRYNRLQGSQGGDSRTYVNNNKVFKFRIKEQEDDFIYKPDDRQFSFYQICHFPVDGKHVVRKLIYNESAEMLRYTEKKLKKSLLDKFLKGCPKYKYSIYPAYDLDVIGFPDAGEVLMARSQILNEYVQ